MSCQEAHVVVWDFVCVRQVEATEFLFVHGREFTCGIAVPQRLDIFYLTRLYLLAVYDADYVSYRYEQE